MGGGMGGAGRMWPFWLLPVVGAVVLVVVVAQWFAVRHRPHRTDGEQERSPH